MGLSEFELWARPGAELCFDTDVKNNHGIGGGKAPRAGLKTSR